MEAKVIGWCSYLCCRWGGGGCFDSIKREARLGQAEGHRAFKLKTGLGHDLDAHNLREILEIFFVIHDPTSLNRQGNDAGTQYRSGIYYSTPEQKQVIDDFIREASQDKTFGKPIVTEVLPLANYWPAEAYHQDYFENNPNQGYCAFVVGPKVEKFRKTFASRVKD